MSTVWRVDAHQHFWRFDPAAYGWIGDDMAVLKRDFLPAELRFELDIRHIGGSVAVQARASEAETDFLLGLASSNPWILGVVGWIDLRAGDLESRLEARASSAVLKGYRHQVQDEPSPSAFLEDGRFNRGVETLQRGGKVYEVLPFGNTLVVMDLKGKEILAALENGVSQWENTAGRFLQVSGLRYAFDLSRPAGSLVVRVEVKTEKGYVPLDLEATYRVVVNNFIANGGDGFTVLKEAQGYRVDTGVSDAESFMDYLKELKVVEAGLEGRIEVLNEPKGERPAYFAYRVPGLVGV